MKRVLILSLNYYPRFVGGAEVALKEITDRVPNEEVEFHMIALHFDSALPKVERIGNVLVHRIGFARQNPSIADLRRFPLHLNKHLYQFLAVWKVMRLHRAYRYDAIWAMMAHSTGIPAGIVKTLVPRIRYLLTLQEGDPPEHIERLARPVWPLFKRAFTKADYIQAISNFLLVWGRKMGFAGKGVVIPNGVDTAKFARDFSPNEIDGMREKLSKREGEVFLVTTSRLVPKNAVDDVLRALPHMPKEITFLIYGIGPDEEKLRQLATDRP
jgi:glycosyltransferase involved in cell wall biosynthesis